MSNLKSSRPRWLGPRRMSFLPYATIIVIVLALITVFGMLLSTFIDLT